MVSGVVQPSDEAFERLLEVTGAASLDDTASVNPAINIGYPGTGATPLMAAAGHGRLTEVSLRSKQRTMRFGSTAKVLTKRARKYFRML